MWPVWVETPSNQGQEARDWEPVYFGLFYTPPGSGGCDKALGVKTYASCHTAWFPIQLHRSLHNFYKSLHCLSLRVPIFMTIVEMEREMLLSLIRNLLNAYRGPQRWAQFTRSTLF